MIQVTIQPNFITANQIVSMVLQLFNPGPGVCTNIRFTIKLPKEILLIRGKSQIQIPLLKENQYYQYPIHIKARDIGIFSLTSNNFSYRDNTGRSIRVENTTLELGVTQALAPDSMSLPSLGLQLISTSIACSNWTSLKGTISNNSTLNINNITLYAVGPSLQTEKARIDSLSPRANESFVFSIRISEYGQRVPIHILSKFYDDSGKEYNQKFPQFIEVNKEPFESHGLTDKTDHFSPTKILFLAANPSATPRLRIDQEFRMIDGVLRKSHFRDLFDPKIHLAVRVDEIQELLLRHQPDIVHFSGHGSKTNEIILEDDTGKNAPVSAASLSRLFSILKDNIRCVVLNSCYSVVQAQAIAQHIDCVIGMSSSIKDTMSLSFSASFYQALGFGKDLKTAFDLGCSQIVLTHLKGNDIPKLICNIADPTKITFVNKG